MAVKRTNRSFLFNFKPMCRVDFPSSFSPGGSGKQRVFRPKVINAKGMVFFNMVISDPGGNVVYETYHTDNSWDGTFQGKPCPKGEYLFRASILESEKDPSYQIQQSGTIELR